jgi:hypothetical protein
MEPPSASQLALTDIHHPAPIREPQDFKSAIENRFTALEDGSLEDSYLSFSGVTPQLFEYIESRRNALGAKRVRFTYFADIETLIVKVPSEAHEKAHAIIGHEIFLRLRGHMAVDGDEVVPVQSTTFHGSGGSSKEADSAYKNLNVRSQVASWPVWVVEGGMSESKERLRGDASWWINHSNGEVQLVILSGSVPVKGPSRSRLGFLSEDLPLLPPGHVPARVALSRHFGPGKGTTRSRWIFQPIPQFIMALLPLFSSSVSLLAVLRTCPAKVMWCSPGKNYCDWEGPYGAALFRFSLIPGT